MRTWLKIVLGVFAALLLVCLGLSGVAYWWFDTNKERLKGVGERAVEEGHAFAFNRTADACLDEGLTRLKKRNGIVDQAEHKIFLKACLERTPRDPAFCDGVPPKGELLKSATWAVQRCLAKSRPDDQDCARLMQVVQESCLSTPPSPPPG